MTHTQTNRQALSADGETLFRLVTISGVPCWQASTGRTFPQVAGAEDPPPDTKGDDGKGDPPKKGEGTGDEGDDFDKPRAMATITKLRDSEKKLKEQLKELDTLKAKQREREDADKSEAERLKEQLAEAQRKSDETTRELQETRNHQAIERAATKAGAADPDDVFRLLDQSEFERDDAGRVTNADELVKALLKAKPYLLGKQTGTNGVPPTPRSNGQPQGREELIKTNREKLGASGDYNPLG